MRRLPLLFALAMAGCPGGTHGGGGGAHAGGEEPVVAGLGSYADHALTPLAQEATALAWAALQGEELPAVRLRLDGSDGSAPGVEGAPTAAEVAALQPVAFLARFDVRLGEGEDAAWLKVAVLLSGAGLSALQAEPRGAPAGRQPEAVDHPVLVPAARSIVAALRAGGAGLVAVPEPLLVLTRSLPPVDAPELPEADAAVSAVRLDDLAVVGRTGEGLYLIDLRVERDDRGAYLGRAPLLSVHRVDNDGVAEGDGETGRPEAVDLAAGGTQ